MPLNQIQVHSAAGESRIAIYLREFSLLIRFFAVLVSLGLRDRTG